MKTYTLKEPIVFGSETINQITLQKPKAKHLKGLNLQNLKFDDFLVIISNLSDMPTSQVEEMGLEDTFDLVDVVTGFLDNGQGTGNTPSA